ncbi:MAG: hypothetical protein RBT05_03605 [Bacteroidales bacterium]|jgi:peptide subunit release factor 1 (eRF1)|nr:hypothetical protein [Bacteroidales bacterium]
MFNNIIGLCINVKYFTINRTRIITSKDCREKIHKYGMRYIFNLEYRKRCNLKERRRRQRIKRRFYKTTAQKNAIREYCSKKQNNMCFWCGNNFSDNDIKTIDHILPISIG